ncbi:hypothetical protein [Microseira sp. BLCC-F43]|jgi:hypothetical protein|uniref:hypothetical protein n=1 Tax=Microseira sp. BLCC-F43 TaxID=3153602 RepID=UPI0035BA3E20
MEKIIINYLSANSEQLIKEKQSLNAGDASMSVLPIYTNTLKGVAIQTKPAFAG